MCVLFIVNRLRVRVVTRYPPSCFILLHTGQLIVFNQPRINNNMPEIKLKHVVSCSTEDSVSCLVTCFYFVETSCSHSCPEFCIHLVKCEPSFLSLLVIMHNRLTRQTTCWALTPTESGKQQDPGRSRHPSFCRCVFTPLHPQVLTDSGYITCCFVITDVKYS